MIAVRSSQAQRSAWRGRTGLAALAATTLLLAAPALLAPWPELKLPDSAAYLPTERWHAAQWGALLGVLAGSVAALAWQPRRADALRLFLLLYGLGVLMAAPFLPGAWLLLLGPVAALSGALKPLFRSVQRVPASRPLLVLGICAVGLLLVDARATMLGLLAGTLTPAHAAGALLLDGTLMLAGLLGASRRPGALWLAGLLAAALIYLGLAAAIVPGAAGGWDRGMSMFASANGWAFTSALFYKWRRAQLTEHATD